MRHISVRPSNRIFFNRLKRFCEEILLLCKKARISPVCYGSLAFFAYTQNPKTIIRDIDFFVSDGAIERLIPLLEDHRIKYHFIPSWHSIQLSRGKLRIELDQMSLQYAHLPKKFEMVDVDGLRVKITSLSNLIAVYRHAAKTSRNSPAKYRKKLIELQKLEIREND